MAVIFWYHGDLTPRNNEDLSGCFLLFSGIVVTHFRNPFSLYPDGASLGGGGLATTHQTWQNCTKESNQPGFAHFFKNHWESARLGSSLLLWRDCAQANFRRRYMKNMNCSNEEVIQLEPDLSYRLVLFWKGLFSGRVAVFAIPCAALPVTGVQYLAKGH